MISEYDLKYYAKRIKHNIKEIDSSRQELAFNQLKICYEEHVLKLNDNFLQNLDLLTSEKKYNYNAFLLADENTTYAKIEYFGRKEQEKFLEGVTAPRNKELIRVIKDVDLIENIGSGVLRILDAYAKSCFKFMDHFLKVSFKYKKNPFGYDQEKTDKKTNKKIKIKPQEKDILNFRKEAKTLKEITSHFGFKDIATFKKNYINPLLEKRELQLTIPDQLKNRNQKYIAIYQIQIEVQLVKKRVQMNTTFNYVNYY